MAGRRGICLVNDPGIAGISGAAQVERADCVNDTIAEEVSGIRFV